MLSSTGIPGLVITLSITATQVHRSLMFVLGPLCDAILFLFSQRYLSWMAHSRQETLGDNAASGATWIPAVPIPFNQICD